MHRIATISAPTRNFISAPLATVPAGRGRSAYPSDVRVTQESRSPEYHERPRCDATGDYLLAVCGPNGAILTTVVTVVGPCGSPGQRIVTPLVGRYLVEHRRHRARVDRDEIAVRSIRPVPVTIVVDVIRRSVAEHVVVLAIARTQHQHARARDIDPTRVVTEVNLRRLG